MGLPWLLLRQWVKATQRRHDSKDKLRHERAPGVPSTSACKPRAEGHCAAHHGGSREPQEAVQAERGCASSHSDVDLKSCWSQDKNCELRQGISNRKELPGRLLWRGQQAGQCGPTPSFLLTSSPTPTPTAKRREQGGVDSIGGGSAARVRAVLLREGAAEVHGRGEVETQVGTSQEAKNSTHSPGSKGNVTTPQRFLC